MVGNASDFLRLSSDVYLLEPSTTRSTDVSTAASSPSTIVVLAWMWAQLRHVSKYTSAYSKLYPNARMLMITTSWADFIHRSNGMQQRRLAATVATLRADSNEKILVHIFSNGGSKQLNILNAAFRKETGTLLPIQALILDSTPGRATFWRSVWTMLLTLPRQWYLRPLLFVLSVLIVGTFWLIRQLTGSEDVIERVRQDLNDTRLMVHEARRCYIYSEADESVEAKDVEDHADDARRKGWVVSTEKFVGSAHVGHMRLDSARYWKIVEELWKRSCCDVQR
jgi:Eukaryotic protein of unknown function (DUF829)